MKKLLTMFGLSVILSTSPVFASIAATVNGIDISVKEADNALNILTKGKTTWEKLPKDGKKQLIHMMAPSKLVAVASKKDLTLKEKEAVLARFWMQKKMSEIKISDEEAKKAYDKMTKVAKAAKSKQKVPSFKEAKNTIKMQLAQEKVVSELMKTAKIKIK